MTFIFIKCPSVIQNCMLVDIYSLIQMFEIISNKCKHSIQYRVEEIDPNSRKNIHNQINKLPEEMLKW